MLPKLSLIVWHILDWGCNSHLVFKICCICLPTKHLDRSTFRTFENVPNSLVHFPLRLRTSFNFPTLPGLSDCHVLSRSRVLVVNSLSLSLSIGNRYQIGTVLLSFLWLTSCLNSCQIEYTKQEGTMEKRWTYCYDGRALIIRSSRKFGEFLDRSKQIFPLRRDNILTMSWVIWRPPPCSMLAMLWDIFVVK